MTLPGLPSFPRYPYFPHIHHSEVAPPQAEQIRAIKATSVDSAGAGMWISRHVHGLILLSGLGLRLGCLMGRRGPAPGLCFLLSKRWQRFADEKRCIDGKKNPRNQNERGHSTSETRWLRVPRAVPHLRMDMLLKPPKPGGRRCCLNGARFGESL